MEPRSALVTRPHLFAALAAAFDVRFGDGEAPAARIVFGGNQVGAVEQSGSQPVPILRLGGATLPPGAPPAQLALANSSRLHRPLRGRVLADRYVSSAEPLLPTSGERVLAAGPAGPVWVWDEASGAERVAVAPPELQPGRTLRELLRPGEILPLLPLVSLLLRIAIDSGLRQPALRAAFLIDDPNLHRPSYGYIDFKRLAERADVEGFHVAFATIPLDSWAVDRRAAKWFRDDGPLSLLVHGNDHLSGELGRPVTEEQGLRSLAQALHRVSRLEQRAGVSVARVMAPPHGRCSAETVDRLARLGFDALCASRPLPWLDDVAPRAALAGWRPAELIDGFPIIPRHHLAGPPDELVIRALLGQPLISYGHHTDAAEGYDVFSDAASSINSLGDVRWTNLAEICRTNAELIARDETLIVRPFSRHSTFELDRPAVVSVDLPASSVAIELRTPHGTQHGRGPHELAGPGSVDVVVKRLDAVDPASLRAPPPRPWPIVRRVLTESRDRLLPLRRKRR